MPVLISIVCLYLLAVRPSDPCSSTKENYVSVVCVCDWARLCICEWMALRWQVYPNWSHHEDVKMGSGRHDVTPHVSKTRQAWSPGLVVHWAGHDTNIVRVLGFISTWRCMLKMYALMVLYAVCGKKYVLNGTGSDFKVVKTADHWGIGSQRASPLNKWPWQSHPRSSRDVLRPLSPKILTHTTDLSICSSDGRKAGL